MILIQLIQRITRNENLLANMNYDMYETDQLKSRIAQEVDIALVYSGDFFDELYST